MILRTRYMRPLGYKGSGMFDDSPSYSHYYKKLPECCSVVVVSNTCPTYIGVFRLTKRQYAAFEKGKLSLVPNGCCSPTAKAQVDGCDVLFSGEFKDHAQFKKLAAAFEATLREEKVSSRG